MADLVVTVYGTTIGAIVGTSSSFDFVCDSAAIEIFGLDSQVLSVAIPLTVVSTRTRRHQRQNFFRELLPEGPALLRLAQRAGVAENDVIGLLKRYGRDIAGAVEIWDPDNADEPRRPRIEPRTETQVAAMLDEVREHPLGNRPPGGKTSLAGVQNKIVLARINDGWGRAVDGQPSTHIVKPDSRDHPTIIYDEEFGARLARAVGLASHATDIVEFAGIAALVIERYDRADDTPDGRVHQEDFNQVLGAAGSQKYQRFSGKVSLERVAKVVSSLPDADGLRRLLQLTVLSVAVGNLDLHAKNISLIHHIDGTVILAPAYDVVPLTHQPNDGEMAMAINREYRHAAITRRHLVDEGNTWGLNDAEEIVDTTLNSVLETVAVEVPDERAHPHLAADIERFTTSLLEGRAAGTVLED